MSEPLIKAARINTRCGGIAPAPFGLSGHAEREPAYRVFLAGPAGTADGPSWSGAPAPLSRAHPHLQVRAPGGWLRSSRAHSWGLWIPCPFFLEGYLDFCYRDAEIGNCGEEGSALLTPQVWGQRYSTRVSEQDSWTLNTSSGVPGGGRDPPPPSPSQRESKRPAADSRARTAPAEDACFLRSAEGWAARVGGGNNYPATHFQSVHHPPLGKVALGPLHLPGSLEGVRRAKLGPRRPRQCLRPHPRLPPPSPSPSPLRRTLAGRRGGGGQARPG